MRYALGVDGGASKTHALIVDETGLALGFGAAGPGNHQTSGLDAALGEVKRAVSGALEQSGLQPAEIEVGCCCLAGADLPEDYSRLQEGVEALALAGSVVIKNDTLAALRSGLTGLWGVVVVCGTGFNAAGRSLSGEEIILPGLGAISGDWGGGYALSQEMIRLVMRAWDGRGEPTLLTDLILDSLGIHSPEALLTKLYRQEIDHSAQLDLVPLLFEASERGDQVARDLIIQMGLEVGITAKALIQRLALENEPVEVVLAGSVFKGKGSLFYETISQAVLAIAPHARLTRPRFEPVAGAALLALEEMLGPAEAPPLAKIGVSLPSELRKEG